MRRLFWLALGVTLGVLIVRKLTAAAERLTPAGVSRSFGEGLSSLAESIGEFGADVRAAMRDRESELREATGLDGSASR
jgi:chromosome condensin MukBEF MukE localization factor